MLVNNTSKKKRLSLQSIIATGKVIERLLVSSHLEHFLNEKNELTPAGYDKVLQLLRAQQA
jgi:hypothetical protein